MNAGRYPAQPSDIRNDSQEKGDGQTDGVTAGKTERTTITRKRRSRRGRLIRTRTIVQAKRETCRFVSLKMGKRGGGGKRTQHHLQRE